MPQPPAVTALSDSLRTDYADLDTYITTALPVIGTWQVRRLRQFQRDVYARTAALDNAARIWWEQAFPAAFGYGAADSATALGATHSWTDEDITAVSSMARLGFRGSLSATDTTRRSTDSLIRRLTLYRSESVALDTADAADLLTRILDRYGVYAARYRDGSLHGIADYIDMLVRTLSAQAYNEGVVTEATRRDVRYFEVSDGQGCGISSHDSPEKADGAVWDAATARRYPLSHPRCQRRLFPRADVRTARQARDADRSGVARDGPSPPPLAPRRQVFRPRFRQTSPNAV